MSQKSQEESKSQRVKRSKSKARDQERERTGGQEAAVGGRFDCLSFLISVCKNASRYHSVPGMCGI